MQMRSIALQNAFLESAEDKALVSEITDDSIHWLESLSRLLSGMSANLSKAVCSFTLGHFIVSSNGLRFQYSHDFANLLVRQVIDVLGGK